MHRTIKAGLAAAAVLASCAASALAAPLIVLGDSTSDAGSFRLFALRAGNANVASPDEGYFMGRFTNGPNVADYVNQALNGELTTSYLVGGDNFAFGGAAIVQDVNQGPGGLPSFIPDLTDQVTSLLARGPIAADADLFVSFAGNDFLAVARGAADADFVVAEAIRTMAIELERLARGGATNVAVSNVGAAGFALAGAAETAAAIEVYNAQLADLLVDLSIATGTRFVLADRDAVLDGIIADPLAFGFDPALLGSNCQQDPSAVPTCTGYLSFDGTHLTTAAAEIVSREVLAAIGQPVPLPGAAILFVGGAGLVAAARRRAA